MISIDYGNGKIVVTTGDLKKIFKQEQLPLNVQIQQSISKEIVWSTKLYENMWASFGQNEIYDVIILDNQDKFITKYYWDILQHGSIFYKSLWLYCKGLINSGKKPKGLAIGTHDGEFGEWVPLVRNFMSDVYLVEASDKQYEKLEKNYRGRTGINLIKEIITPNGGEVEFFEGGRGYTNSVVERVIRSWETEEVNSSVKNSVSLNDLIKSIGGNLDWIHMDVEGLDVKLILSLEKEYIPNFIIYEDFNLSEEDQESITNWIKENNFTHYSSDGIAMISRI
jgi:FkbM family methyltransferase